MNIRQYRTHFIENLNKFYDAIEAESIFYLILQDLFNLQAVDLALEPEQSFTESELIIWNKITNQLHETVPVQYILGKTKFYGLEFKVNPNVLIPRPETEELVDWIVNDFKNQNSTLEILDIGCGSGCIAISIAKNLPKATVSAIDISEPAIEVAIQNANHNETDIIFIKKNILETESLQQKYDIIVSNPPYVRELEKVEITNNVLLHEPHLALFVTDENPLIFYQKITQLAFENLSEGGCLYFEINQYLGKETLNMMQQIGFENIEIKKDIYENQRMIKAIKS
jgi:release factor glutamine methyltransferase